MRIGRALFGGISLLLATWACGDDDGGSAPEPTCFEGAEGCRCDAEGECRRGLVCLSNRCVVRNDAAGGASDGGASSSGATSNAGTADGGVGEPDGGEPSSGAPGGGAPVTGGAPAGGADTGGAGPAAGGASGGAGAAGGDPASGGDPGAPPSGGAPAAGSAGDASAVGGSQSGEAGSGGSSGATGNFGSEPVFFDDFEDGDVAGWSFSATPWLNVEQGDNRVLTQNLQVVDAAGAARIGETGWTDQWVDVAFKFADEGDPSQSYVFVGVRYQDGYNSAYVQLYRGGIVLLGEMSETEPNTVTQNYIEFNHDLDLDDWHTLGIKAEGETVTAYLDGVPVAMNTISRTSGNVALSTTLTYTSVYFDDVKVFLPE